MDTLFLYTGKVVWILLRPETILVLLFVLPRLLLWRRRSTAAGRWLSFALLTTVFIGFIPVGIFALNPLERAFPAHPDVAAPSGIIVLGGMEDEGPAHTGHLAQVNDAGERLIATIELARQFPDAYVLFTGGKLALRPVEAGTFQIGPDILRQLGLPEDRLIVEGRSRSTAENASFAREVLPDGDTGPWILVTSAYHMPRALGSFCAAGWRNLIPYPVDFRGGDIGSEIKWDLAENLRKLNIGAKEWIGLLAYRLTGRTTAFIPDGCA